jgi:hypothetical protein
MYVGLIIMAKRKAARRRYSRTRKAGRRHKKSIPLIPLATAIGPSIITFVGDMQAGFSVSQSLNDVTTKMIGIGMDGKFDPAQATNGMIALGGIGISIVGRKLGLNKYVPLPKGFRLF